MSDLSAAAPLVGPVPPPASRIAFGHYVLDVDDARLTREGVPLDLPPRAFALLTHLARQPRRLVRKDELLDAVWGHRHISESVLKTVISQIRALTGDDPRAPRIIETVPRRGYRFVAAVAPATPAAPRPAESSAPALAADVAMPHLIGRRGALAALGAAWSAACKGRSRLVLVAGEPGIGKSTLIEYFLATCPPDAIAIGQCVDRYGAGEPYAPLLEALDTLIRHDPGLLDLLRTVAPTWLMQLPWHLDEEGRLALGREIAGATQDRMLREFGILLERASQHRTLLIVIEDLHWSDDATVHLLDFLARRRAAARVLLIGSFRPADVIASGHGFGQLRRELRLHRLCDEIHLEGFNRAEVADFLHDRLVPVVGGDLAGRPDEHPGGHADRAGERLIDPATVAALHRHTDGLPLFVASVVDELLEQGLFDTVADGGGIGVEPELARSLPIPDNLAGVIEHQLLRLGAGDRALLQAAALIGAEFDHLLLAEATEADPDVVLAAVDVLVERRLWLQAASARSLPDGRISQGYAFRHALHRHVLDASVGPAARARLHRGIAAALQRLHEPVVADFAAELALHCERGHEPSAAAGWYLQAARNARQRLAQAEALALVDRGLRLLDPLPPGPARAAELPLLSLRIAGQMTTLGQGLAAAAVSARRALALMDRLPLTVAIAPLWHAVWWVNARGGDWPAAHDVSTRMAALIDDETRPGYPLAALQAQRGILALHQGRHGEAISALEGALTVLAAMPPDQPPAAFVQDLGIECLAHLSLGLEFLGRFGEARAARQRLQARVDAGTDPLSETTGLWFIAFQHLLRNDLDALGAVEVRAMRGIAGRDALSGTGPHRVVRGWHSVMTARTGPERDAALSLCGDGSRVYAEHGARSGMPVMHRLHAEALIRCGRLSEAGEALRVARQEGSAIGEDASQAEQCRIEAALMIAAGESPQRIRGGFDTALAAARRESAPLLALRALVDFARWARGPGDASGRNPASDADADADADADVDVDVDDRAAGSGRGGYAMAEHARAARDALAALLETLEPDPTLPLMAEARALLRGCPSVGQGGGTDGSPS